MAWVLLPVDYTDAVWSGLKRFVEVSNDDGTVSFQDVTIYTSKEKSFFGAKDANRMNEALNTIMSMVENGTNLYAAFQNYFAGQKTLFEQAVDTIEQGFNDHIENAESGFDSYLATTEQDFKDYVDGLKAQGDTLILEIKTDYQDDMNLFKNIQEQIFQAWFQAVRNQLDQDAAGNLQNQCTELDERLTLLEQMTLQNDFSAPIATDDADITLITDDLDFAILADWKYKKED
ncbi:MAG: hypothetical protein LBR74_04715 [Eubacterium sp.]|jgi:hypothetical protein|nr:hypothetical protein [Eubacterium sp.]